MLSMVLHYLVLNFRRLMRQQLHAADVRCIRILIAVVADLRCHQCNTRNVQCQQCHA